MPEQISRRDFLKLTLSGAAGLVVGKEGLVLAKELVEKSSKKSEKKEIRVDLKGFLSQEVDYLAKFLKDKFLKTEILSEWKRIGQMEAEKTLERRFNNNSVLMRRYFAPFLERREEIVKALDEADPKKQVPREVSLGIIGMESGGKDAKNPESGAAGIFQFTKETAQILGLAVSEKNDERFDLKRAAIAVIKYLLDLYEYFGRQWGLALMAYSGGPTKLEDRLREKFDLDKKEKFTPELFQNKAVNAVTVYSEKFKHLGMYHSVQYPFGAQIMANLMKDLTEKKKSGYND